MFRVIRRDRASDMDMDMVRVRVSVSRARTGARARAWARARARATATVMARKRRRLRENILMIIPRIILRTILIKSMLTRRVANCSKIFRDGCCLSFR
jgi:hypothetical protein